MISNAGCWKRRLVPLAITTSLLSACATVGSNPPIATVCRPVVQYSGEHQAQAAEKLLLLPEGSAIVEMPSDYTVMREKARLC